MNRMLEKRISRLEKLLSRKNEQANEYSDLVYSTVNNINDSLQSMFNTLFDAYNQGQDMQDVVKALRFTKGSVPEEWQDRFDYLANELMK